MSVFFNFCKTESIKMFATIKEKVFVLCSEPR